MDRGRQTRRHQRPQLALGRNKLPRMVSQLLQQPILGRRDPLRRVQSLPQNQQGGEPRRRGLRERAQGEDHSQKN
ncbi:unnamed protein product [Brassica oleracea]